MCVVEGLSIIELHTRTYLSRDDLVRIFIREELIGFNKKTLSIVVEVMDLVKLSIDKGGSYAKSLVFIEIRYSIAKSKLFFESKLS